MSDLTKKQFYLISILFVIITVAAYLHAFGILDPFKQLPCPASMWLTMGIGMGILLARLLELRK